LLTFYQDHPNFILPKTRRNEVISFVKGGLIDLSISRTTFNWGVPVPGVEEHIMYVWLDALTNYLTAVGFPDPDSELFQNFWPADLHMVGKDILRFHAVYWPAFLLAAGLPTPKRVFAHGWWTNEGEKISKSLGNVIDPIELVNTYGLDQVRYFLLREVPFGSDGDFSTRAIVGRINSDLANDYGNLAQRVLSMIHKNCGGKLPEPGPFTDADNILLNAAQQMLSNVRKKIDVQAFHEVLETIWVVIRQSNGYVDVQAPWKLKKEDPDRMNTVLYALAETIRHLALLTQPFMPNASARILDQLSVSSEKRTFSAIINKDVLVSGTEIPKPDGVFPRYVEEESLS
jgi:methionyl-tRNA synthetase